MIITCPTCAAHNGVPDNYHGVQVTCFHCRHPFTTPSRRKPTAAELSAAMERAKAEADRQDGSMAVVGFTLAILSVFTFGLIAPLALFLSALGTKGKYRGLATAGVVISALASVGLVAAILLAGSMGIMPLVGRPQ